jgi:hypothetical protein
MYIYIYMYIYIRLIYSRRYDKGTITKFHTDACSEETWSIMYSFYFTFVVIKMNPNYTNISRD